VQLWSNIVGTAAVLLSLLWAMLRLERRLTRLETLIGERNAAREARETSAPSGDAPVHRGRKKTR
jgi:hypothetical protein